jgi:hypothetical protein
MDFNDISFLLSLEKVLRFKFYFLDLNLPGSNQFKLIIIHS